MYSESCSGSNTVIIHGVKSHVSLSVILSNCPSHTLPYIALSLSLSVCLFVSVCVPVCIWILINQVPHDVVLYWLNVSGNIGNCLWRHGCQCESVFA